MSAASRNLARIPLEVFQDLKTSANDDTSSSAQELREAITNKLKSFPRKTRNGIVQDGIKTVGPLLELSKLNLLRALDPLLTYGTSNEATKLKITLVSNPFHSPFGTEECNELLRRICIHCAPKPTSAFDLLHSTVSAVDDQVSNISGDRMRYLPTGLASLDKTLRGGVRVGTITELVGRAGAGKTQLSMQLCVMAARYGQGCVYIDTENKLSLERLKEIAARRASAFNSTDLNCDEGFSYANETPMANSDVDNSERQQIVELRYRTPQEILQNATVHTPASTEELVSTLSSVEDEILLRNQQATETELSYKFPVRLLVLDSIAAPARRDFGSGSAPQRAAAVVQCAQTLKRLADQLHLAVIVINQFGLGGPTNEENEGTVHQAALGTAWHQCVSTRLLLENNVDQQSSLEGQGSTDPAVDGQMKKYISVGKRQARVVKSNVAGQGKAVEFEVSGPGLSEPSS